MPDMCCLRGGCGRSEGHKVRHRKPLITWESIAHTVPWGLILLLGGGFALAESIKVLLKSSGVAGASESLNEVVFLRGTTNYFISDQVVKYCV